MNLIACGSSLRTSGDFPIFTGDAPNSPIPSYNSRKTDEQCRIELLARKIFFIPGSYEKLPASIQENSSLTHLALAKNPHLILQQDVLPEQFHNNSEMIKTALIAAINLSEDTLRSQLLRNHPEFLETANRLVSISDPWKREQHCLALLVQSNPLLFQFLPACWQSNDMVAHAASEGDPANFRFYGNTSFLTGWPVELLKRILDLNFYGEFLTIGQQLDLIRLIHSPS